MPTPPTCWRGAQRGVQSHTCSLSSTPLARLLCCLLPVAVLSCCVPQGAEEMAQMEHLMNVYASKAAKGSIAEFLGYCEVSASEANYRLTEGLWLVSSSRGAVLCSAGAAQQCTVGVVHSGGQYNTVGEACALCAVLFMGRRPSYAADQAKMLIGFRSHRTQPQQQST